MHISDRSLFKAEALLPCPFINHSDTSRICVESRSSPDALMPTLIGEFFTLNIAITNNRIPLSLDQLLPQNVTIPEESQPESPP
jgi:hypothetical protein